MPATIAAYHTFLANTRAKASEGNRNFSNHRGTALPINEDTATASDNSHDLGSAEHRWRAGYLGEQLVFTDAATSPSAPLTGTSSVFVKSDGVYLKDVLATERLAFTTDIPATPETFPKNWIINGNFDFWQRNTSFAAIANSTYTADRWKYIKVGAMVHTVSRSTDVPTLAQSGFQSTYSLLVDCTTADAAVAAGDVLLIRQIIEGYSYAQLKNRTVTLNFWVKATKTGTYCVSFNNGSQDRAYVAEYTVSATNTWEEKSVTVTLNPSGGTDSFTTSAGLYVDWCLMAGTTYQTTAGAWQTGPMFATANQVNACDSVANDFRLAQVQFVVGSTAPDFSRFGGGINGELKACQRYYEKSYNIDTALGTVTGLGAVRYSRTGGQSTTTVQFKANKRVAPTIVSYSPVTGNSGVIRDYSDNVDRANVHDEIGERSFTQTAGLGADGNGGYFHWTADAEL